MTLKDAGPARGDLLRATRLDVAAMAAHDVQRLVHDLQLYQAELEAQNESLLSAQCQVEISQSQYAELFDCAPVGYLVLDAAGGVVVRANAAALSLLAVPRARLIGQRLSGFVAAPDLALFHAHLHDPETPRHAPCDLRMKAPNGVELQVRLDTCPLPSTAGEFLVVLTDISERKRSIEALEQMNRELEARNRQFEAESLARARSEAEQRQLEGRLRDAERLESLGLLAAGVAHDFNNLLVSVLGHAELALAAPGLASSLREPLSLIKRASLRATDLTRQLLVFAGRGQPRKTPVDLTHVVSDCLELVRTSISARTQLQTQITHDLPAIEADRGQVHQLVMNLVTNAIEAVEGEGLITIRTRVAELDPATLATYQHAKGASPGRFAILHVQDSGPGIDADSLARVFDPFFTTKFTGRGLGLATVLGVVQSHHGALRVRSQPGEGTCFEVAFALTAERSDSDRPPALLQPAEPSSGSILLIDDDDGVREVLERLLTLLGFSVTAANGGAAGIEAFRRAGASFDFVVLDWIMPGCSGKQVLSALRELDADIPVVLVSGYNTEDLVSDDAHVSRVQKPMTLEDLCAALRSVQPDRDASAVEKRRRALAR